MAHNALKFDGPTRGRQRSRFERDLSSSRNVDGPAFETHAEAREVLTLFRPKEKAPIAESVTVLTGEDISDIDFETWAIAELEAQPIGMGKARLLLYSRNKRGEFSPCMTDDEAHLAALRDGLSHERVWGKQDAWAVQLHIGADFFRAVYQGRESQLRRVIIDKITRIRLEQAGALDLDMFGVPMRIQRVELPGPTQEVTRGSLDEKGPSAKEVARTMVDQFDVRAELTALAYKGVGLS